MFIKSILMGLETAKKHGTTGEEKYVCINIDQYYQYYNTACRHLENALIKADKEATLYAGRQNSQIAYYDFYHIRSQNLHIKIVDIIERQKTKGEIDTFFGVVGIVGAFAVVILTGGTSAPLLIPVIIGLIDSTARAQAGVELTLNAHLGKIAVDDVHWIRGSIPPDFRWIYDGAIIIANAVTTYQAAKLLAKNKLRIVDTKSEFGTGKKANPNNVKVNKGQQDKHIQGTNNYKQEVANGKSRSILTEDPQQLLDDFAGSGQTVGGNKERIDFGDVIGQYYDSRTGQYVDTTNGIIHYDSSGGAHIVPGIPNGYN